jgi:tRNA (guanine9-N1)-methyltransferase
MRKLSHDRGVAASEEAEASAPEEVEVSAPAEASRTDESTKDIAEEQKSDPGEDDNDAVDPHTGIELPEDGEAAPKISKNQLKKQRRLERWEAGREDRKLKRKEKIQEKKQRRREEGVTKPSRPPRHGPTPGNVPITVVFDCDFEDLMFDNELKSLGLQLTRCYSDNRKAKYQAHLAISSFGGKLKERFDGILAKQYTSWKGVRFYSEDFVHAAERSQELMKEKQHPSLPSALSEAPDSAETEAEGEIVYLSSESDVTLDRLKPNSTYIIGGLVDKNRHKGVCYKRAVNRGIKTAKLPIGEFLQMNSRQVLVTNHVLEIMLKWMEFGDWGKAFMEVIPKRKGGVLKTDIEEGDDALTPDVEETSGAGEEVDGSLDNQDVNEEEPMTASASQRGPVADEKVA